MADVKDKQFLRGEVRDMVRVRVPALQQVIEELMAENRKLSVKMNNLSQRVVVLERVGKKK